MNNLKCLLGMHSYSNAYLEFNLVDKRDGHFIFRVRNSCIRCGKPYEDIISMPIPEWLRREIGVTDETYNK